jgi:hypothetical protein
MKSRRSVFFEIMRVLTVIAVCLAIFLALTPATFAGQYPAVAVRATIGPCISVAPDGTITSNVSAIAFEGNGLFTVMAR